MSRADLARGTGLSRTTVSSLVTDPTGLDQALRAADTAAVVRVVPGELGERAEVVGAVALAIARVAASS